MATPTVDDPFYWAMAYRKLRPQSAHRAFGDGVALTGSGAYYLRKLFAFDWPGNVRQLRNVIESMVVIDIDEILDVDDLPVELADEVTSSVGDGGGESALIGQPLSEIERWAIEQTLQLTGGNREETARILGIGARTLYRKIKEYGF